MHLLQGPGTGPEAREKQTVNGQVEYDTVTAQIPAFQFIDQDGAIIDTNTVKGKIYVVDFFFTHCPPSAQDESRDAQGI